MSTAPKLMEIHTSGGIENLVRDAATERAKLAALQAADEKPVEDNREHMVEVEATRAYLTEALKLAHEKYTKASPLLRNELCIVEQAIEHTLERVVRAFYRD